MRSSTDCFAIMQWRVVYKTNKHKKHINCMKREIENKEIDPALKSVYKKKSERGLLKLKDFIAPLILMLVLFLSSTMLYAQNRSVDGVATGVTATQPTVTASPSAVRTTVQPTEPFDTYAFPPDYFPRFAIKTNLLYGATTTPNLGVEFFLNRYFTLDIAAGWNPFVHRDNVKFAHWMIQPTLRYWIQEPFNGHLVGLSLMYCEFNVSGIRPPYNWFGLFPRLAQGGEPTPDRRTYRFRGNAISASIQYGFQWVLSPRWSIEATINFGYMLLRYEQWTGGWCGERLPDNLRHYLGPTNAGISLIYIFR